MSRNGGRRRTGLRILDKAAAACGLLSFCRRVSSHNITVLMYHKVLPDETCRAYPLPNLVVPLSHFRAQVDWLQRHCQIVTVTDAVSGHTPDDPPRHISHINAGNRPTVCITFDDGYADNALFAAPVLQESDCPATFFVTTDFIAGQPLWFDVVGRAWQKLGPTALADSKLFNGANKTLDAWLGQLKRIPFDKRQRVIDLLLERIGDMPAGPVFDPMGVMQLRQLADAGHEIAAHTLTHPILPDCSDERLHEELTTSRQRLEHWLDRPVIGMSYPNGDYNPRVTAAAAEAGYRYACTTDRKSNPPGSNPLTLGRQMIGVTNSAIDGRYCAAMFAAEVSGWHARLRKHWPNHAK